MAASNKAKISNLCYVTEHGGTMLLRALLQKKVTELRPHNEDSQTWTMDTFLQINKNKLESKLYPISKQKVYPVGGNATNLDLWDLSLLLNVIQSTCGLSRNIDTRLSQLKKLRNKLAHLGTLVISDASYEHYFEKIKVIFKTILEEVNCTKLELSINKMLQQLEEGKIPNEALAEALTALQISCEETKNSVEEARDSIKKEHKDSREQSEKEHNKTREILKNDISELKDDIAKMMEELRRKPNLDNGPSNTIQVKIRPKNCDRETEETISEELVEHFNEAIAKGFGMSEVDDSKQERRRKVLSVYKNMEAKGYHIVKAEKGCILLHFRFLSTSAVLSFYVDYIHGDLDKYLDELKLAFQTNESFLDSQFEMSIYLEDLSQVLHDIGKKMNTSELDSSLRCQNDDKPNASQDKCLSQSEGRAPSVLLTVKPPTNFEQSDMEHVFQSAAQLLSKMYNLPMKADIVTNEMSREADEVPITDFIFIEEKPLAEKTDHNIGQNIAADGSHNMTCLDRYADSPLVFGEVRPDYDDHSGQKIKGKYATYKKHSQYDEELQTIDQEWLSTYTSDEIPLLFDEVRHTYDIQSLQAFMLDQHPPQREQDAMAAFEEAFSRLKNKTGDYQTGCVNCSKQVRVQKVADLRKGQHLVIPIYREGINNKDSRWVKKHYNHHAIVTNVKHTERTRVVMELVHFTNDNNSVRISKTTETFDLRYDEIWTVEYKHHRCTENEIVLRAECMLSENEKEKNFIKHYNLLADNCEYLATYAHGGQQLPVDIRETIGHGLRKLFGENSHIAKGIFRNLFISPDKIAYALTNALQVPAFFLGGDSVIYLIYCTVMTAVHIKDYYEGQMCWSCCKRKCIDLWASFGMFNVTSVLTFFILHFALPLIGPFGIPFIILLLLLSAVLQWNVTKIQRALLLPYHLDKEKVNKLSELEVGDIISLRYYGLVHDVILTEVHQGNLTSTVGIIRCIHYGLPTLFGTREIIEENFTVNLEKATLTRYDYRHLLCYSSEQVVCRARKRLGETKWAMFSNRSDHFCFWAKVRQRPLFARNNRDNEDLKRYEPKSMNPLLNEIVNVHLMEEIQIGDVFQYKTVGLLSAIKSLDGGNGRLFELDQIFYDSGWIVQSKTFRIDLSKDTVYVKKFNPAYCHPMETRAARARRWIGKEGKWWTTDGFIEECILLTP